MYISGAKLGSNSAIHLLELSLELCRYWGIEWRYAGYGGEFEASLSYLETQKRGKEDRKIHFHDLPGN